MLELLDLRERGERLDATRLETDPTVADTVAGILRRVFVEGDEVLVELARRFDQATLDDGVLVSDAELEAAAVATPPELRRALDELIARLQDLAARQLPREWWDEREGDRFGEIDRPLESVGCYVPGGLAPVKAACSLPSGEKANSPFSHSWGLYSFRVAFSLSSSRRSIDLGNVMAFRLPSPELAKAGAV
jgi:antitoxin component of MazEF toxin-antitoxin module